MVYHYGHLRFVLSTVSLIMTMETRYQICVRCAMDTSDPQIAFDESGVCNHCTKFYRRIASELPPKEERETRLTAVVERIRSEGTNRDYDCVAGVSGGVDSTYVLYKLKELGLRPLAVHFDNGWNSELAVANIKSALDRLKIDLHTIVVDWDEFRNLQLSFLKAGVPNCEIPTDHAITAVLVKTAAMAKTRFVINGSNLATEGILPISWVYYSHDSYHLSAIHRRFGNQPLRTFPKISLLDFTARVLSGRYKMINLLNYLDYDKSNAMDVLKNELGWQYYGGKHYESIYTRWYQGYYLPQRFGFDKRRAHYSALVCSGQMTRDAAIAAMTSDPYVENDLIGDTEFVLKKFGMTAKGLETLMSSPRHLHTDYPNLGRFIEGLSGLRALVRSRAKSV